MKSPIVDQFGRGVSANSWFYQSANFGANRERRFLPVITGDVKETSDRWSRMTMLGYSRLLSENSGLVSEAVRSMSVYSVGNGLVPQSRVTDQKIAQAHKQYFADWSRNADIQGIYTFSGFEDLASQATDVDGDIGFLKMRNDQNRPRLQVVEGHRIGSATDDEGFNDGVSSDASGRPLQYKVKEGKDDYRAIDANNFLLVYEPFRGSQKRGITRLKHAINNCRDIDDLLYYAKVSAKMIEAIGFQIISDSGALDSGAGYIESGFDAASTGNLAQESFAAGMIPRLKPGEEIKPLMSNHPQSAFQGFIEFLIRDISAGMGLPFEFVWDPTKCGGANQRFVLAKAQRRFDQRQNTIITRLCNPVWAWVIGDGIHRKEIPFAPNWMRAMWHGPAKITVDVGREANANRDDMKFGVRTMSLDAGEQGLDWRSDIRDQFDIETEDLMVRAEKLVETHPKLTLPEAISLLRQASPNPPIAPVPGTPILA